MVRLKGAYSSVTREHPQNFNSYMVRLKEHPDLQDGDLVFLFQFLYGTIKRYHRKYGIQHFYIFQFLYGTIKSFKLMFMSIHGAVFQFLYGTIKSIVTTANVLL